MNRAQDNVVKAAATKSSEEKPEDSSSYHSPSHNYVAPVFGRHHKAFVFQDFLFEFSPQYIKHINYDRQPSRTRTSAYASKYNFCNLQAHVDSCHSIRKRRMVMVINTEFAYQLS